MVKRRVSVFAVVNAALLVVIALAMLYPFLHVLLLSVVPPEVTITGAAFLVPPRFSLSAYAYVFGNPALFSAFKSSLIITVGGTALGLFLTSLAAYVFSKPGLPGYRILVNLFIFTMYFSGGMIPTYLLINALGLIDSYWAVFLTGSVSVFFLLVMRTFFRAIPASLEEAAVIDGASELDILLRIYLPLSLPVLAAVGLFFAVDRWNMYFTPLLYLNDRRRWPVQVILKEMLFDSSEFMRSGAEMRESQVIRLGKSLKMATIVVAILPIAMVYPFLQKHFVKGVMIGAIKG